MIADLTHTHHHPIHVDGALRCRGQPAVARRAVPAHPVQVALFARSVRLRPGRGARTDVHEVAARQPARSCPNATSAFDLSHCRACPALPTPTTLCEQEALWKKDVWPIASEPPRPATPRRCGMPSAAPWPTRPPGSARELPGRGQPRRHPHPRALRPRRPALAGGRLRRVPHARGRQPVDSRHRHDRRRAADRRGALSARPGVQLVPPGRVAGQDSSRRDELAGDLPQASPASTSKARSTVARTTGRSGAGIASALGKASGQAPRTPDGQPARLRPAPCRAATPPLALRHRRATPVRRLRRAARAADHATRRISATARWRPRHAAGPPAARSAPGRPGRPRPTRGPTARPTVGGPHQRSGGPSRPANPR